MDHVGLGGCERVGVELSVSIGCGLLCPEGVLNLWSSASHKEFVIMTTELRQCGLLSLAAEVH